MLKCECLSCRLALRALSLSLKPTSCHLNCQIQSVQIQSKGGAHVCGHPALFKVMGWPTSCCRQSLCAFQLLKKKNPFQCQVVGCVFSVVPLAPQPRLGGPVVPYLTITVWAGSFGASGL